jgi:hypothetical protein
MTDLGDSLERMTVMQLALLFTFLTSYVLALGRMLGSVWRRRAAVLALVSAVGFAAFTDPWVHGALLMVFVVAGLGLFVTLAWLLARLLSPARPSQAQQVAQPTAAVEMPASAPYQGEAPAANPQGTVGAMR